MKDQENLHKLSKVGAVLVAGGGIAGVQASLDLANSGFKVYLVEKTPCIGGVMAQLDKTFPTNDCAMCILSPKLVEAGRHQNIQLITNAKLVGLSGEPGNFHIKVKKNPRYVIEEKCTGCGKCVDVCPVKLSNEFDAGFSVRRAIFVPFPQGVPLKYSITKFGTPPCRDACPAHVNVQGYVALIREGKLNEALNLIREKCVLPGVCARICPHFCETACNRKDIDESIAIRDLKRFVSDNAIQDPPKMEKKGIKVAIIGAGPAGLAAAYNLALKGYTVTIFERLPIAGGMLAVGIPDYRLPGEILKKDIDYILKLGVEIRTNVAVGEDIQLKDLKDQGYKAIFIAIGAHKSRRLKIEGEDLLGVVHAIDFLRDVNLGTEVKIGRKVAVIGGGNAAIDAARTALRLGAEVTILYRRTREEMPAYPEEIEEALEEGVRIKFLMAPTKVLGEGGQVKGLELVKMRLGEPDESGRRRPIPIEDSTLTMDFDTIVPAISQSPELSHLLNQDDLRTTKWNTFEVDSETLATNVDGIFAGGDAVRGPSTAIEAIADGSKAATYIDKYIQGESMTVMPSEPEKVVGFADIKEKVPFELNKKMERHNPLKLEPEKRKGNFDEVGDVLTKEEAESEAARCLNCGGCSECMECVKACDEIKAIDHEMKEEEIDINVGSLILAPGSETFDATLKGEYGYGIHPNVVSSIEFERILSASGPFMGHVVRPSDHITPKKIAFIQCVGSREKAPGNPYCSSVCCMYAIKEAIIAKEHVQGLKAHIFHMDIRAFGKEFDDYYNRAKDEHEIEFIRARPSNIEEDPTSHNLIIHYVENDEPKQDEFDMVVLSVGLKVPEKVAELGEELGIRMNQYRFADTDIFSPLSTSRPGVFVCGAFSAPKDIPDTVAEASGAAAKASSIIASERGSLITLTEYPPEKPVGLERPRIGVFICHCGINIGGVVDVLSVVKYAKTLPFVAFAEQNIYTCSQDTQEHIKEKINEYKLNRIVVAACTPRTHEPLFQNTMMEVGLNPYLFEMANIRDQCSWVHMQEPGKATEKAKDLVRMAVSKAKWLEPLKKTTISLNRSALIIGGGVSGMTAALGFAEQGYDSYLIEKEKELGGNLRHIYHTITGENPQEELKDIVKRVEDNERIRVYKGAKLVDVEGYVGNFKSKILQGAEEKEIEHGVIIVATGAMEYKPTEYLYGKDKRILTQLELEECLENGNFTPQTVVMIQCVGSRGEFVQYCSRICCTTAIKNALRIKAMRPNTEVYIFYRDIRTYGFKEGIYQKACEQGIRFIRFEEDEKPVVALENGKLKVTIKELLLEEEIELNPDLLVLSSAILPHPDNDELSQFLKVPLSKDDFFLEAHMKLRPVDFATSGIFLCGMAHSPKFIDESISQAYAAVSRACIILSKEHLESEGLVSVIDQEKCNRCEACIQICPYNAIEKDDEGKVMINELLCESCGACAGACKGGAIQQRGFNDYQILSMVKSAFEEEV